MSDSIVKGVVHDILVDKIDIDGWMGPNKVPDLVNGPRACQLGKPLMKLKIHGKKKKKEKKEKIKPLLVHLFFSSSASAEIGPFGYCEHSFLYFKHSTLKKKK